MKQFEYRPAESDDLLHSTDAATVLLAGGTDLLPSVKVGLVAPDLVVDVKRGSLRRDIERTSDGWRLGALATLADLEDHAALGGALAAVGEAASQAATRQLRNRATVAGNLLQRSRCSYYRDPSISCWLDGSDGCPARIGRNEHHAIFETGPCVTTQPSDLASVLVALDATVAVSAPDASETTVPVTALLAPPTDERRSLHTLEAGELITSIHIPRTSAASCYLKAMDRAAWQFALVGLAAVTAEDGTTSLVASGVGATPWRLTAAEAELSAGGWSAESVERACAAAVVDASPLEHNGYKRRLLQGLVRGAARRLG